MRNADNTWRDAAEARGSWEESEIGARTTWVPTATAAALAVAANIFVIARVSPPVVGVVIGFWFLLLYPVYLLASTSLWRRNSVPERVGYSLGSVLLILMLGGLAVNAALPLVTSVPPLGRIPVVLLGDFINIGAYFLRRKYPMVPRWRHHLRTLRPEETRLVAISVLAVALAVLGANRLNNGAGNQVALAAIGVVLLVVILQLRWTRMLRDNLICVSVYAVSLALLLGTSLRGWFVTGHDIQDEYRVFQLTALHGHWSMTYWHDAYNACLSITILPTMLSRMVGVTHPYIYKLVFQLIFAFCPVLIYSIVSRYWIRPVAILAVAYFIGFPTFFNDMPFLNRQEIAYLFVCIAILAATNAKWSPRTRQIALLAAGIGVEISHYSTMYVLLGALAIGWVARQALGLLSRGSRRLRSGQPGSPIRWAVGAARTTSIGTVLALSAVFFVWGDVATQTSGQLVSTAKSIVTALGKHGDFVGGASYGIFSGRSLSPQEQLQHYRQSSLNRRESAPAAAFLPLTAVSQVSTPVVDQPQPVRPLGSVGRVLDSLGIPVVQVNTLMRDVIAYAEQLFVAIGLIALILSRRLRSVIGEELFWLAFGSTAMVALITVLPGAAANYGVLRAYQQGLITMAPVLVVGTGQCLRWFSRRPVPIAAVAVVCLGFFVTTTSLLSQMIGGNIPELNLNNNGTYYDIFYVHPQDERVVGWLSRQPTVLGQGVQASYAQNRFLFTNTWDMNPQNIAGNQVVSDLYPTLVRRASWVVADYSMIHSGVAAVRLGAGVVQYRYPMGILQANKNLVYDSGSAEVYR